MSEPVETESTGTTETTETAEPANSAKNAKNAKKPKPGAVPTGPSSRVLVIALVVAFLLAALYYYFYVTRRRTSGKEKKDVGAVHETSQIPTCDTFDCGAELVKREPFTQDGNTKELCCRKLRCSDRDASGKKHVDCAALGLEDNLSVEEGATKETCCLKKAQSSPGSAAPLCSAFDCPAHGRRYEAKPGTNNNVGNSLSECCQLKLCSAVDCIGKGLRQRDNQKFGFNVETCCEATQTHSSPPVLNGTVTKAMTPFASSAGDAARPASAKNATVLLNKASERSVHECFRFCSVLERGLLANLAPVSRKALDSCQCFRTSSKSTFEVLVGDRGRGKLMYAGDAKIIRKMCAKTSASPECDAGTAEMLTVSQQQCDTAEKTGTGFHTYRSELPLLETPVHVWFDAPTQAVRYMRVTNRADTGRLEFGMPAGKILKATSPIFRSGDLVFADMRLGIVFKNNRRPAAFSSAAAAEERGTVGKTKFGEHWYNTPSLLQCGIIRRKSDGMLATRLTFTLQDVHGFRLGTEKPASSGKLAVQADETITFVYRGVHYKFANRAYGASDDQEFALNPVYPKVDYAPSPMDKVGDALTRFDYSHLLISKTHWLRMPLSIGKMSQKGVFTPSTPQRSVVVFLVRNGARPDSCLSCKARQEAVCDEMSVLIGCGFETPGRCGTCYMPALAKGGDDQPCGNCQIGRLHVKTTLAGGVEKIWTDATKNILANAHRHDTNFNVEDAYFGPFLGGAATATTVSPANKVQKAGLYAIEHAMKDLSMRKRMAITAKFTGSDSNSKVGFCVLANNNSYTNVMSWPPPPSSPAADSVPGTLFHTTRCNACGINWCGNYELHATNILQNKKYSNSGKTLQARGCDGVTSAWRSVRDSGTRAVYAVPPSPRSEKDMTMHVDSQVINEWLRSNHGDRLHGYNLASTLNGLSYGPSICQYGTTYPNGFDGGFCTLAFGDIRLYGVASGARYGDMSSNSSDIKEHFHFRKGRGINWPMLGSRKDLIQRYMSEAFNDLSKFAPTIVWSIQPRVLFPKGAIIPTYNVYQGALFPTMDRTVRIYNDSHFKDSASSKASSASVFNDTSRSRYFDLEENTQPASWSTYTAKGLKLPPVTSVHVQSGGNCMQYTNTSVRSVLVEVEFDFPEGAAVAFIGRANIDQPEKLGECASDASSAGKNNDASNFDATYISPPDRPNSSANVEDYVKPDSLVSSNGGKERYCTGVKGKASWCIAPYCKENTADVCTPAEKPDYRNEYNFREDAAWHLVPRIAAECRAKGFAYHHRLPGDEFYTYLQAKSRRGELAKRHAERAGYLGCDTKGRCWRDHFPLGGEEIENYKGNAQSAEWRALFLPYRINENNKLMMRCDKRVRADMRVWTGQEELVQKGKERFYENVIGTTFWGP